MQVQTIDEVIGANMRFLREGEALTLVQCAETLAFLTGKTFSEARLSRWETGHYSFTINDLHTVSQIYGVNLMGLLKPIDDDVTHVQTFYGSLYPVDSYVYDFFIDPRGTFADRAEQFAERNKAGTRDVVDALNDIRYNLGDKGRIGDLHMKIKAFRKEILDTKKHWDRTEKELQEIVAANEAEGTANGVDREEPE